MINKLDEKLLVLSNAQESMTHVADIMEQWDSSQFNVERIAYESINLSDSVLNMSKEGCRLTKLMEECCKEGSIGSSSDQYLKMSALLKEIQSIFQNITETSAVGNEICHQMEEEIANQRELQEDVKSRLSQISENLDVSIASTELILSEL